jgi:hypothetical protein
LTEITQERANVQASRKALRLPPGLVTGTALLLLLFGFGPNLVYAVAAGAVLILGAALLWRPGENPVLLFLFGYQWLQASALIFLGNARDERLNVISKFGGHADLATVLSLLGVLIFAMGMRLGAGPRCARQAELSRRKALEQPVARWFWLYAAAALLGAAIRAGAWILPALSQPMLAVAGLKWAFFFVLAFAAMVRGRGVHPLFVAAFVAELAAGVGGYFSDFKTVFFVTILAALASGLRLSARAAAGLVAGFVALAALSVVWTAVKGDYREFVSGGLRAQVVTVDYGTRLAKLYELVDELDRPALEDAAERLIQRVSYVEFFGVVIDQVPATVPHAGGEILKDAIARPLMPRLFFPNKSVINDSERTNYFTGLSVTSADQGTSISLGWLAEAYIDFGPLGMFLEVLGIGFTYGLIYRLLSVDRSGGPLLGGAMALAVLLGAAPLESSITKVIGGVIVSLLVAMIVLWGVAPRYFPWTLSPQRRRARFA